MARKSSTYKGTHLLLAWISGTSTATPHQGSRMIDRASLLAFRL
jgi:hypothetical protein